jgi:competence protein ComEA
MPQVLFPQFVVGVAMLTRYWAAVGGLFLLAVSAALWFGGSDPDPAPLLLQTPPGTSDGRITVHVAGEVVLPGLVVVNADARVADAVAAAGGSTRAADLTAVNLAAALQDGEQIVIPGKSAGEPVLEAVDGDGRVRVNRASVNELEQLPGVGPVLAARIAAYREQNGPFRAVEDLLDVAGIGEGKLATLRDAVALP